MTGFRTAAGVPDSEDEERGEGFPAAVCGSAARRGVEEGEDEEEDAPDDGFTARDALLTVMAGVDKGTNEVSFNDASAAVRSTLAVVGRLPTLEGSPAGAVVVLCCACGPLTVWLQERLEVIIDPNLTSSTFEPYTDPEVVGACGALKEM